MYFVIRTNFLRSPILNYTIPTQKFTGIGSRVKSKMVTREWKRYFKYVEDIWEPRLARVL